MYSRQGTYLGQGAYLIFVPQGTALIQDWVIIQDRVLIYFFEIQPNA